MLFLCGFPPSPIESIEEMIHVGALKKERAQTGRDDKTTSAKPDGHPKINVLTSNSTV